MASAGWLDLKRELFEQEERYFERASARILRLKYPQILQTPARQKLDRAGIDLVVRDGSGGLLVAVQCKGFGVQELGSSQIAQSIASLDSFLKSEFSVGKFIFLYNREGKTKKFTEAINSKLATLVAAGKCKSTALWDLDKFLKICKEALRERLDLSIRAGAKKKLELLKGIFEINGAPLTRVPAQEKRLYLTSNGPARIEDVAPMGRRSVKDLLKPRSSEKFTLLIGNFGTGKSTAGLLAASGGTSEQTVIFAECALFPITRLGSGLSPLLEEFMKAADAFSELPFRNQELLHLASPLLRAQLSGGSQALDRYVLLLDGLDENRIYSTPEGMAILINSLADIHCPIILTTRREHFISAFDAFASGRLAMEGKGAGKKPIRVFVLGEWTRTEIIEFVKGAVEVLSKEGKPLEAARLGEFQGLLSSGREEEFYNTLAAHPLFLRLILDDVAANGIRKIGRAKLLWDWSVYKIERDLRKRTQRAEQNWTFGPKFIDRMMVFMEDVAALMSECSNEVSTLREQVDDTEIEDLAQIHFPEESGAVIMVLLNSLLVPHALLENRRYTVHFVYRAFHEFFLAAHYVRKGVTPAVPGTSVDELISELRSENFAWVSDAPERIL